MGSKAKAMKFFIDTADIREIYEVTAMGIIDGVTDWQKVPK